MYFVEHLSLDILFLSGLVLAQVVLCVGYHFAVGYWGEFFCTVDLVGEINMFGCESKIFSMFHLKKKAIVTQNGEWLSTLILH